MINCQATKRPTHCDILSKTKVTFSTDGFLVAEVIRNIRVPEAVKKKKKKRDFTSVEQILSRYKLYRLQLNRFNSKEL